MKYTKGPWVIEDGSHSGHCCFDESILGVVDGEKVNIAEVIGGLAGDAKLILTAPEMYEALLKCRHALEPYSDIKPRDWKTDQEKLRQAFQLADKVLKKLE